MFEEVGKALVRRLKGCVATKGGFVDTETDTPWHSP